MTPSPSPRSPKRGAKTKRPHPAVPVPDHYSPYAYPHFPHQRLQCHQSSPHPSPYNSISNDLYHPSSQGGDPHYYLYHPYARTLHKPGYHVPHPPLPHPPAPPAPPRPQRSRAAHRSSSASTVSYYRAQAQYDSQHLSGHPDPSWDGSRPSQSQEEDVCLSQSLPECEPGSRSETTGSRVGSEMPENTPSPVDLERIRRWEEQQSHVGSYRGSTESGSYHEYDGNEDRTECGVIDPALMHTSHSRCSSLSNGNDARESTVDDVSLDDIGDVDFDPEDAETDMLSSQKRPNSEYYPSPHHQAQFAGLAKKNKGAGQHLQIGLNSLVDGEPGTRPAYPIPTIIKCAILGSPHRQLTLSELYTAMEERFPYYRTSDKKSWRNSVRHNLSLNNQFDKKPRPMTEPGKGHYWVVNTDIPQGNKRERKRNKKLGKRALAAEEARQARERQAKLSANVEDNNNSDENDADKDGANKDKDVTNNSRLPGVPRKRVIVTLPPNAGSYAAVTGAITMPAIDRQLFRPWLGDTSCSSSSIGNDSIRMASSGSTSSGSISSGSVASASVEMENTIPCETEQSHDKQGTSERPPPKESSQRLILSRSPMRSRAASRGSGSEEEANGGVHRTSKSRDSRVYNPNAVGANASAPSSRPIVSKSPMRSRAASQVSGSEEGASCGLPPTSKSRDSRVCNPIAMDANASAPSPRPIVSKSPMRSRAASQVSGSEEGASCGLQRTSKSRNSRACNPIAVDANASTPSPRPIVSKSPMRSRAASQVSGSEEGTSRGLQRHSTSKSRDSRVYNPIPMDVNASTPGRNAFERPPPEESSPRPIVSKSPMRSRAASQGTGSEEEANGGVQRTSKSRDSRAYNPIAVGTNASTPRRSAFETLAAQIEREGIGAIGSGGPGSRSRRQIRRGKKPMIDSEDSDSDSDPSGDSEYLPTKTR